MCVGFEGGPQLLDGSRDIVVGSIHGKGRTDLQLRYYHGRYSIKDIKDHGLTMDEWDEVNYPRPEEADFDRVVEEAISRRGFVGVSWRSDQERP